MTAIAKGLELPVAYLRDLIDGKPYFILDSNVFVPFSPHSLVSGEYFCFLQYSGDDNAAELKSKYHAVLKRDSYIYELAVMFPAQPSGGGCFDLLANNITEICRKCSNLSFIGHTEQLQVKAYTYSSFPKFGLLKLLASLEESCGIGKIADCRVILDITIGEIQPD